MWAAFAQTVTSNPGIVTEIGPIQRSSDDALAKYAGLTWRTHQSGQFARPLTRSGNVYLQYDLIEAGDKVRMRDLQLAAFFERKYREATHHAYKWAGVLTARKLLDVVYGLLTLYNPRKMMPQ